MVKRETMRAVRVIRTIGPMVSTGAPRLIGSKGALGSTGPTTRATQQMPSREAATAPRRLRQATGAEHWPSERRPAHVRRDPEDTTALPPCRQVQ